MPLIDVIRINELILTQSCKKDLFYILTKYQSFIKLEGIPTEVDSSSSPVNNSLNARDFEMT